MIAEGYVDTPWLGHGCTHSRVMTAIERVIGKYIANISLAANDNTASPLIGNLVA